MEIHEHMVQTLAEDIHMQLCRSGLRISSGAGRADGPQIPDEQVDVIHHMVLDDRLLNV